MQIESEEDKREEILTRAGEKEKEISRYRKECAAKTRKGKREEERRRRSSIIVRRILCRGGVASRNHAHPPLEGKMAEYHTRGFESFALCEGRQGEGGDMGGMERGWERDWNASGDANRGR